MAVTEAEIPPALLRVARFVLLPWRAGWSLANGMGMLGDPPVGPEPHLDPASLAKWRAEVARAETYLEYGSGGSTVAAAQQAKHLVSVDSDAKFLTAARDRAELTKAPGTVIETIPVDIGRTEMWGRPLVEFPTPGRLRKWARYTSAPWDYLEARALVPDFVFVDGRFRVACVLESLLRLPQGSQATVMLDDFARRTRGYGAVLDFADGERCGRGLVLRRKAAFDRDACLRELSRYQRDPE